MLTNQNDDASKVDAKGTSTSSPVDAGTSKVDADGGEYTQTHIKELIAQRDEEKKARRELEKRLANIEDEAKRKEQASLEEQGKYKDLFEKSSKELETLKPLSSEIEELRTTVNALMAKEAEGLDEALVKSITTNTSLSIDERFAALKSLREKLLPKGSGTPDAGGDKKTSVGKDGAEDTLDWILGKFKK